MIVLESISEAAGGRKARGDRLRVGMVHYMDFHVDSRLQRLAFALAESGAEVHVVCLSDPVIIPRGEGTIHLHRAAGEKRRGSPLAFVWGYASFLAGAFRKLTGLHRARPLDVVSIHNAPDFVTFAALVPKAAGTPIVFDVHDPFPDLFASTYELEMSHPLVRLLGLVERVSASLATTVVTVHREARERLESRGVGGGKHIPVFLNTPAEEVFGPQRDVVRVPEEGPLRVVYHGGLAPRYGVESLVRAFGLAECPSRARLEVHGLFEGLQDIKTLAREVAPERTFVADAPTPFEQIPELLTGAHVGVVPPLLDAFTEIVLPVKLFEYIHMGLPVVVSRLPAIEQYFDDSHVYYVTPGSSDEIAAAIAAIAADPAEAGRRATAAAVRLDEFAWRRQRQEYVTLFRGLARG